MKVGVACCVLCMPICAYLFPAGWCQTMCVFLLRKTFSKLDWNVYFSPPSIILISYNSLPLFPSPVFVFILNQSHVFIFNLFFYLSSHGLLECSPSSKTLIKSLFPLKTFNFFPSLIQVKTFFYIVCH